MNIEIRRYNIKDSYEVNMLIHSCFGIESKVYNLNNNQIGLVAVSEDIVTGFLIITKVFDPVTVLDHALVDYVCVSKEYQGNGIGHKLMEEVINISKEEGYSYIQLTSNKSRVTAHKLYESLDFKIRETDVFRRVIL